MNIYLMRFFSTGNQYLAVISYECDYKSYKIIERINMNSFPGLSIGEHISVSNVDGNAEVTKLNTEQLGEILLEVL